MKERPRLRLKESSLVCSFCHDRVAETARACPACGTVLHRECWLECGSCPVLGCEGFSEALEEQWQFVDFEESTESWVRLFALLLVFTLFLVLSALGLS